MRALDRKALRDIWHLKTQLLAVGLVSGCGVAMIVLAWSTLASLQRTQETYYARYQFSDVFAHLKRAPQSLAQRIEQLPGVAVAQTRIVHDATLDLPNATTPAMARLISLPEAPHQGLNQLHLRMGCFPQSKRSHEIVVSEGFADANRLVPGDHLYVILNGRRERLDVVGIVLSPEFVYQIRPGEIMPNDRTFAVVWMDREALAAACNLDGAFNDVVLTLRPGANERAVIDQLDHLLTPYGAVGALGRDLQTSHRYVTNELRELQNMGYFAPIVFLLVASFLMYLVLSRMIGNQREQIATLKAFGYTPRAIGWHYLWIVVLVALVGVGLGSLGGAYLGRAMTRMYTQFFRFPVLEFQLRPAAVLGAAVVSVAASLSGVLFAVRRAVQLPPAAAMQPEPPSRYRPAFVERLSLGFGLSPSTRMVVRHLESRPISTLLTVTGLALAVAIMVLGNHAVDAIDALLDMHFFSVQRQDVSITFTEPTSEEALHELRRLPGVHYVEPMGNVAVRMRSASRARLQDLQGLPEQPQLFRLMDREGRSQELPWDGVVLSAKLAELLETRLGDELDIEVLDRTRPHVRMRVAGLIDDMIGTAAYLRLDVMQRLLREGRTITGALLAVEQSEMPSLFRALKESPRIMSVSEKRGTLASFRSSLVQMILRMRAINVTFATIITCGVVYNSARITVAERARDLASLRVLGYTRREISTILLGELAIITALALPLGLMLGYGFVVLTTWGYDTDLFRIPVVVYRGTYAWAALTVLVASFASALFVRRRLDRLDLVAVLKTRE